MPLQDSDIILDRVSWTEVDELVRRQQRSRERHAPGISMYRWWARRPHALIGALLDAASDDGPPVVSDPFSGGGTVAMEAARRGLGVYAQDLHPWAAVGLASTLDGADSEALAQYGRRWLDGLAGIRQRLYGSTCPQHGAGEVLHTFWVRTRPCAACGHTISLFPYALFTLDSRTSDEKRAWYGCRGCGAVQRGSRARPPRRCRACEAPIPPADEHLLREGRLRCPHDACAVEQPAFAGPVNWRPVLVQRLCGGDNLHFAAPTTAEIEQATAPRPSGLPAPLEEEIPLGVETARLRRAGLLHWRDLYPPRQLQLLLAAGEAAARCRDATFRARLRLVVCGAAEMAGYASRWDRYYPKAFEATANHRFALTGLGVETNLLADRGRGTLPRRLNHSVRAARWAREFGVRSAPPVSAAGKRRPAPAPQTALVARGSSARQLPPDGSIDLVLTDPPYFDDVQYAELAALFLTWAHAIGLVAANVHLDMAAEAVANSRRSAGVDHYRALLTRIMRETARTLSADGSMILTFHNSDGRAWWALGSALGGAGFRVAALAVAHAENETDHAKRNAKAFSCDLVLECRLGCDGEPQVATAARDGEPGELLAAGLAVAGVARRPRCTYETFCDEVRSHLGGEPKLVSLAQIRRPVTGGRGA